MVEEGGVWEGDPDERMAMSVYDYLKAGLRLSRERYCSVKRSARCC